jgi:UDP-3-O-[3-hydroxymyristoyl] glucosamine N-acyltransferase
MRLSELATKLGCELRGDGNVEIVGVAPIETAEAGEMTFVANPRYARHLETTRATAVILALDAAEVSIPSLRSADPYGAFARAIEIFFRPIEMFPGVHPSSVIDESAHIGPGACVGPCVVIGAGVWIGAEARIGAHVVIYPEVSIGDRFVAHARVTVRERVRIGNDVILHAGAVIGSDGFGYVAGADGSIHKITQAGNVVLEDDVEIGANTTVDRAAVGSTIVRRGAKIDNLVMIAHGCEIGEGSMIAAQVGLSGSTKLGRYVRLGGQVGCAGHLTIGDGAQVAAQSGVPNSIAAGATVGGTPAADIGRWRRASAAVLKLPELLRRVRRLERAMVPEPGDAEEP